MSAHPSPFRPSSPAPSMTDALKFVREIMDASGIGWSFVRMSNQRVAAANDFVYVEAAFRPSDLNFPEVRRGPWTFLLDRQQVGLLATIPDSQIGTVILSSDNGDPDDGQPSVTELSFSSKDVHAEIVFYRKASGLSLEEAAGVRLEAWEDRLDTISRERFPASVDDLPESFPALVDPVAVVSSPQSVDKLISSAGSDGKRVTFGGVQELTSVDVRVHGSSRRGDASVTVLSGDDFRVALLGSRS